jgi:hypothetical protein
MDPFQKMVGDQEKLMQMVQSTLNFSLNDYLLMDLQVIIFEYLIPTTRTWGNSNLLGQPFLSSESDNVLRVVSLMYHQYFGRRCLHLESPVSLEKGEKLRFGFDPPYLCGGYLSLRDCNFGVRETKKENLLSVLESSLSKEFRLSFVEFERTCTNEIMFVAYDESEPVYTCSKTLRADQQTVIPFADFGQIIDVNQRFFIQSVFGWQRLISKSTK